MAELNTTTERSIGAIVLNNPFNPGIYVECVPLGNVPIKPSTPNLDRREIHLQGTVRTNNKVERLVTLCLVDGQVKPEDNKVRAWLFQPEISVEHSEDPSGKSVFIRRPWNGVVVNDPERDRLVLIYRNQLEFAGSRAGRQGKRSGVRYRTAGILQ